MPIIMPVQVLFGQTIAKLVAREAQQGSGLNLVAVTTLQGFGNKLLLNAVHEGRKVKSFGGQVHLLL